MSPGDLEPPTPFESKVVPFRDIYQTAVFLGTRYALALSSPDERPERRKNISTQLAKERLYEIGRNGAVELGVRELPQGELDSRRIYAGMSLLVLLGLGILVTAGRPGPAMKEALAGKDPFSLSTMVVSGLTVATWGFALGVLGELAFPGWVGPARAAMLALTLAILFWVVVYPGHGPGRANAGEEPGQRSLF